MKKLRLILLSWILMTGWVTNLQGQDTAKVMFYNLLNFPTGGGGIPARQDTLAKIISHTNPDIFMVCELVNNTGNNQILSQSLNINGVTYYSAANFVPNISIVNLGLQNQLYYNSNKFTLYTQNELITDLRDINEYILYYNDPNLPISNDTTWLDMYVTHLKASSGGTNETRRNQEITVLRDHLNARPGRNVVFGADLNVYRSSEPAYQTITTTGVNPLQDPINRPGTWHNNFADADIHTQSSRSIQLGGDGASGGMDDRFDQILVNGNVMSGSNRVQYIPGTYEAVGQDGLHYNSNLLAAPTNAAVPQNIATALYYMSDHLPVYMELEINPPPLLPIELESFWGRQLKDYIKIEAKYGAQEFAGTVQLERLENDGKFKPVAVREFSPGEVQFQWTDPNPKSGNNTYRLLTANLNGEKEYSHPIAVHFSLEDEWDFQVYNPGKENISFQLTTGSFFSGSWQLIDPTGRIVNGNHLECAPGKHRISQKLNTPAGIYFLLLQNKITGETRQLRFLKLD